MRLIISGFTASLFFFILTFVFSGQISAVSVCAGTINCHDLVSSCQTSAGQPCVCGSSPECNLYEACDGSNISSESCGGFNSSQCSDGSFHVTYCNTGCPGNTGSLVGASCSWQADACTGDGACGSNRRCCAGTPNYCSNNCYDCAGNYICAVSTPTPVPPTPTPLPSCDGPGQYGYCSPNGATAPSADGSYLCSGNCWAWVPPGGGTAVPTPTTGGVPTSAPTPTTGGGGR